MSDYIDVDLPAIDIPVRIITRKPRKQYRVLDSWALCKGDGDIADKIKAEMRDNWKDLPRVSVNVFKREVRAGGARIPLTCIVVRQRIA